MVLIHSRQKLEKYVLLNVPYVLCPLWPRRFQKFKMASVSANEFVYLPLDKLLHERHQGRAEPGKIGIPIADMKKVKT